MILAQAQIENYTSSNSDTTNLENAFKTEDKNAIVTKSNAIYEVTFEGKNFLVSNDYKYIERIEPENVSDWEYNSEGNITAYLGNDTDIIVPNYINGTRIKTLYQYVFQNNNNIEKVQISEGIETLDVACFNKSSIREIKTPNSIIAINTGVFQECLNLEYIELGNNIQKIGSFAFHGCQNLKGNLKLPDTLIEIGNFAFASCKSLEGDLHIPKKLIKLDDHAFYYCEKITGSVKIPDTLTKISANVFEGCKSLNGNLIIPDTVTEIGVGAFSRCKSLNGNLKLPINLNSLGHNAFSNCSGFDGDIIIPNGITSISQYAFYNCNCTGILYIPNSVTEIGTNAFAGNNFSKVVMDKASTDSLKVYQNGDIEYSNIEYLR